MKAYHLQNFQLVGWSADSFTNWITDNGVNIATNLISAGVGGAVALATANPIGIVGSTMSIAGTIANTIGQFRQASLMPQIQGGNNSGDVNFSSDKNTFVIRRMRCKKEFMQIIDDYFSKFGYKINRVKLPNITGRTNWNFIKTIDCNCDGDIPQEDLETIRSACNSGVTFWHTPANIYNYSLSNSIV